jgi:hypothetical protein
VLCEKHAASGVHAVTHGLGGVRAGEQQQLLGEDAGERGEAGVGGC